MQFAAFEAVAVDLEQLATDTRCMLLHITCLYVYASVCVCAARATRIMNAVG